MRITETVIKDAIGGFERRRDQILEEIRSERRRRDECQDRIDAQNKLLAACDADLAELRSFAEVLG